MNRKAFGARFLYWAYFMYVVYLVYEELGEKSYKLKSYLVVVSCKNINISNSNFGIFQKHLNLLLYNRLRHSKWIFVIFIFNAFAKKKYVAILWIIVRSRDNFCSNTTQLVMQQSCIKNISWESPPPSTLGPKELWNLHPTIWWDFP